MQLVPLVSGQGTSLSCEPSLLCQRNVLNSNDAALTSACDSVLAYPSAWICKGWRSKDRQKENDRGREQVIKRENAVDKNVKAVVENA